MLPCHACSDSTDGQRKAEGSQSETCKAALCMAGSASAKVLCMLQACMLIDTATAEQADWTTQAQGSSAQVILQYGIAKRCACSTEGAVIACCPTGSAKLPQNHVLFVMLALCSLVIHTQFAARSLDMLHGCIWVPASEYPQYGPRRMVLGSQCMIRCHENRASKQTVTGQLTSLPVTGLYINSLGTRS